MRYRVTVEIIYLTEVEVEADTEDQAKELVATQTANCAHPSAGEVVAIDVEEI